MRCSAWNTAVRHETAPGRVGTGTRPAAQLSSQRLQASVREACEVLQRHVKTMLGTASASTVELHQAFLHAASDHSRQHQSLICRNTTTPAGKHHEGVDTERNPS